LFAISYSSRDPVMAKNVVDSLLTIFAEKAATSSRVEMERAQDFLQGQIGGYEAQLREAEQRRADFRKKYGQYLGDPSSGAPKLQAVQQQVAQARQEYEAAVLTKETLEAELKAVPQFRMVDSPTIAADGKIVAASPSVRLAQARAQYQELQLKFTARHPDVEAAKHRVEELEAQLASREPKTANEGKEQVPNPTYGEIRLKLVGAQVELPAAKQRLDRALSLLTEVKEMSADIPDVDAKAKDLDRDYEIIRKNHDELVQRRQAAQLSQAADEQADRTQFRIIDPPQVPLRPSFPNFPMMFSLVLLGGVGIGLALPIGIEMMRATYASVAGLRTLGLPVIGAVTFAPRPGSQRGVMAGAAGAILCVSLLLATYGLLLATNTAASAAVP
jgi:polysaccharide chain length determinant protein (PEP-CTERM system associated)